MNPQLLVESLGWDKFLPVNMEAPRRIRVIRELLNGGASAQVLCERGDVQDRDGAAYFKGRIARIAEAMENLQRHTSRSRKKYLSLLISEGNKALDQFLRNPAHPTLCILEEFGEFARETLSELQRGTYTEGAVQVFLGEIVNAEIPGDTLGILALYEAKDEDRHKKKQRQTDVFH